MHAMHRCLRLNVTDREEFQIWVDFMLFIVPDIMLFNSVEKNNYNTSLSGTFLLPKFLKEIVN